MATTPVRRPIVVERSRVIAADPFRLWNLLADPDALPRWFAPVARVEVLEGVGEGRRQTHHGSWGGRPFAVDVVVTVFDPGSRIAWRHVAERLDGRPAPAWSMDTRLSLSLDHHPRGTRVTLRSEQVPATPLKGLLMRLMARRRVGGPLDRSLDALARLGTED